LQPEYGRRFRERFELYVTDSLKPKPSLDRFSRMLNGYQEINTLSGINRDLFLVAGARESKVSPSKRFRSKNGY
jgi:hypothetical protein